MVEKKFRDPRLLITEFLGHLPIWCSGENLDVLYQRLKTKLDEILSLQLSLIQGFFREVIQLLIDGGVKAVDIESCLTCIPDLSSGKRKPPSYYASKLIRRRRKIKIDGIDSLDL